MVGEGKGPVLGVEAVSRRRFISYESKEEISISGWVCSSQSSMPFEKHVFGHFMHTRIFISQCYSEYKS